MERDRKLAGATIVSQASLINSKISGDDRIHVCFVYVVFAFFVLSLPLSLSVRFSLSFSSLCLFLLCSFRGKKFTRISCKMFLC